MFVLLLTGSILSFAEAASFGGLVTSTDPVAVLAILGQLRLAPFTYTLYMHSVCMTHTASDRESTHSAHGVTAADASLLGMQHQLFINVLFPVC
jgi:hypothetical protein